ncbi:MAG: hypothetical protein U0Q15_04340 [Kineosporiaceae bacterium]
MDGWDSPQGWAVRGAGLSLIAVMVLMIGVGGGARDLASAREMLAHGTCSAWTVDGVELNARGGKVDVLRVSQGAQRRDVVVAEPIAAPAVGSTSEVCVLGDAAAVRADLDVRGKVHTMIGFGAAALVLAALAGWHGIRYRRLVR